MSGHVFHPGHHELHGITVVLRTADHRLLVGRFDSMDEHGVRMMAVSGYDATRDGAEAEFLKRTNHFGVRVDVPKLTVANELVVSITPLAKALG